MKYWRGILVEVVEALKYEVVIPNTAVKCPTIESLLSVTITVEISVMY
jgi:hypothetical protein